MERNEKAILLMHFCLQSNLTTNFSQPPPLGPYWRPSLHFKRDPGPAKPLLHLSIHNTCPPKILLLDLSPLLPFSASILSSWRLLESSCRFYQVLTSDKISRSGFHSSTRAVETATSRLRDISSNLGTPGACVEHKSMTLR